jgi:hypothetical protein
MTAPCSDGSNLVSAFATWLAAEGRADRVEDHKLQSRALLGHCRPPDSNFDFSCTKRPECTSTLGRDRIFRIWRNFESSAYAQELLLCLPASYGFFWLSALYGSPDALRPASISAMLFTPPQPNPFIELDNREESIKLGTTHPET